MLYPSLDSRFFGNAGHLISSHAPAAEFMTFQNITARAGLRWWTMTHPSIAIEGTNDDRTKLHIFAKNPTSINRNNANNSVEEAPGIYGAIAVM